LIISCGVYLRYGRLLSTLASSVMLSFFGGESV